MDSTGSNPSPFGTVPKIGQTVFSSNSSAFGLPSLPGVGSQSDNKNPFSQTATATSPVFGATLQQNVTSPANPNMFGSAPSFTSTSPFGNADPISSSASLFGSTSSSSPFAGSNRQLFGRMSSSENAGSSPPVFGGVVSSPSTNTALSLSSPFGNIASSAQSPSGGLSSSSNASLFGSGGKASLASSSSFRNQGASQQVFGSFTASASTSFGATTTTVSSSASFGGFGASTSTDSPFGTSSGINTDSVFGSSIASSSANLFGTVAKNTTSSSFSLNKTNSSSSPSFGNVGTSSPSSASILFGSKVQSTSPFSSGASAAAALFGKNSNTSPAATLFNSKKDMEYQGGLFQKKINSETASDGASSSTNKATNVLFGKPQTVTSSRPDVSESGNDKTRTASVLFGKPILSQQDQQSSAVTQSSALTSQIGKDVEKPTMLFGKPQNKEPTDGISELDSRPDASSQEKGSPQKSIGRWKSSSKGDSRSLVRKRSLLTSSLKSTEDMVSDDAAPSKSLVVRNVPDQYCDREILRGHFSRFGKVMMIRVTPEKNAATVVFDSKDTAHKAKSATRIGDNGLQMDIFYRQPQAGLIKRSPSRTSTDSIRKNVSQGAADELKSMAEIPEFEPEPSTFKKAPSPKPQRPMAVVQRSQTPPRPPRQASPTPHSSVSVTQGGGDSQGPPDVTTVNGLLNALKQARAVETNDRIAILNKRDDLLKLLRKGQQADLSSATAFRGTCPDMCPEKERYYREDTRRLALYEVIASTMSSVTGQKTKVDHAKAVKEYSRSSADQKEPLSHELRPLPVLLSTMVYLLKNVADEGGEGRWSEWYDFLWNRTRGIRKEITQQQLCDVRVANLMEQCVRFHIFCSERLCEEDMMTFDDKINNENLTKCLQTLKELYEDLETKHSSYCPNEAEIRSYIVLMNLNQGDTLREVQQLRSEIQNSPHIRFAVQAYNALNSCNYVRFFRLIKKTTFLNGCILHRYFNQIRSKALHIMKKSMGTIGKTTTYPVSELMRLLCFENASEVMEFCSHYGVRVENSSIVLDGSSLINPDGPLPKRRSITLIESKRTVSVGEIIYGGPLPDLVMPAPFSSFNANGQFVFSPEFKQALEDAGLKTTSQIGGVSQSANLPEAMPAPVVVPECQPLPLAKNVTRIPYPNEFIKSAARELILEETDCQAISVVHEVLEREVQIQTCIKHVSQELLDSVVKDDIRSVAKESVEQEEQALRHALELASQQKQSIEKVCDGLLGEVVESLVKDMTSQELKLAKEECHRQMVEASTRACADDLVDLVSREQIAEVASEIHQDVVAKRERLAVTEAHIVTKRLQRYFQLWQKCFIKRQRVKRAMLDFPVAPPNRSHAEQLSALVPARPSGRISRNGFYVGEKTKMTVRSPMASLYNDLHLSASLSMASARQMLSGLRMWRPLDIVSTAGRQLASLLQEWKDCDLIEKNAAFLQWKLVLSTPGSKLDEETDFAPWLKTKLSQEKATNTNKKSSSNGEGEVISQYTSQWEASLSQPLCLSFCVRCFHGHWNDNQSTNAAKKDVLKGMSGLVLVTSDADRLIGDETYWKKDRLRLQQLLTKKAKRPSVPLVIIIPRLDPAVVVSSEILDDRLELTNHYDKGLLSAVHFAQPHVVPGDLTLDLYNDWTTQLSNCMRFLASRVPAPPSLAVKALSDFVEDGVVEYFKASVYQDLRTRTRHQLLHQSPNTLLSFYNDVIDHLGMVVASDTLTTCSWPAPEFDQQSRSKRFTSTWNSQDHLCAVYELMTKMRLPSFRYTDLEVTDWASACQDVWKFLEAVTKKDSGSAKICLYQKVADLLQATRKHFDQFCWLASEDGDCEPSYVNMAWTDLVDACIHYKIVSLRTGHFRLRSPEVEEEEEIVLEEDDFEDIDVYYNQTEFEDYEVPSAWEEALRDTETMASLQVKDTVMKRFGRKRNREDIQQTEETVVKKRVRIEEPPKASEAYSLLPEETDPVLHSLSESFFEMVEKEKEASERYEKTLASLIDTPGLHSSLSRVASPILFQLSGYGPNNQRNDTTPKRKFPSTKHLPDQENHHSFLPGLDKNEDMSSKRTALEELPNRESEKDKGTLSERLKVLMDDVESEKKVDKLFEMKLQKWMMDA